MAAKPLYELRNVVHRYEGGPVTLDIEALRICEGGVVGLVGPNGSGKSTLLKVLAFLEPAAAGEILFDGAAVGGREAQLRLQVTYLLQDSYLLKRSVYDNIDYGLKLRGLGGSLEERIYDSLSRVGLAPREFASSPWYRLSGGEVQRAALASRLVLHPRVLLLDEPTANVDEASALLVKDAALSAWKEWGTTVITATHDLSWLHEISTEVVSLYHGRVIGTGTENFIQGAWRRQDGGAALELSDGQLIRGPDGAPYDIAAAVLSPSKIEIAAVEPERRGELNVLAGAVTQMTLERGSGRMLVSVEAGGLVLKARAAVERARDEGIFPGSA